MHQIVIGRSREVRGPDGMERGVVGVTIAAVLIIAMGFGTQLALMVETLDAVALATGPKYNAIVYRAVHGQWPSKHNPYMTAGSGRGVHVKSISLDNDGVIVANLALAPPLKIGTMLLADDMRTVHGSLSFRPELLGPPDAPSITFLCGHAKPIGTPSATIGENTTTLDKQFLPPFCR